VVCRGLAELARDPTATGETTAMAALDRDIAAGPTIRLSFRQLVLAVVLIGGYDVLGSGLRLGLGGAERRDVAGSAVPCFNVGFSVVRRRTCCGSPSPFVPFV
jgi:ribosomal protein S6E (S10)